MPGNYSATNEAPSSTSPPPPFAMAPKTSLRDKLDEDTLDLSLMQLEEVPVQEIVRQSRTMTSPPTLFQPAFSLCPF